MLSKEDIIKYLIDNKTFLQEKYNIEKIGIFGSFAKNQNKESSDIDLIYLMKNDKIITYYQLYELESLLKMHLKKEIDLINYKYINPIIKYSAEKDIVYVW